VQISFWAQALRPYKNYFINKIMTNNFETIKATLKDKWLDYYEANQSWIAIVIEFDNLPQNRTRPHMSFILGVISALEPKLNEYFYYFSLVTNDEPAILKALGLDFDPQLELEKRAEERKLAQEATLVQNNNVIGLLSEDLEYREVQEGIEEIRAQFKQLENSS
jgi:hypothetical protein